MVKMESRTGIPGSDGSAERVFGTLGQINEDQRDPADKLELKSPANESSQANYLPGETRYHIPGISPIRMKLRDVLKAYPKVRDDITSKRLAGLYAWPVLIFGGIAIFSATHPNLLGRIGGDMRSLRKPIEKGSALANKLQKMIHGRK